jgi:post-segregation antitoxin (ccd killing protein)
MSDITTRAIDEAISRSGGVAYLGAAVGVAHSSVVRWRQEGRVPAKHVLAVETATGVARHRLRPDLYPPPVPGLAEAQAPFVNTPPGVAAEARALGLDPEAIAEKAIQDAIRAEKQRRWKAENQHAIAAWNDWTEANELPLEAHRAF